jgi:hypothetical protein
MMETTKFIIGAPVFCRDTDARPGQGGTCRSFWCAAQVAATLR